MYSKRARFSITSDISAARAKELCHLPESNAGKRRRMAGLLSVQKNRKLRKNCCRWNKMSVAQTAHSQLEQAYQLVAAINGFAGA